MKLEEIIQNLEHLKSRILRWPEEILNPRDNLDVDQDFTDIEQQLESLLELIKGLDQSVQTQLNPIISQFYNEVAVHQEATYKRLEELKGDLDTSQTHAKAIRAYTKA